MNIKYCDSLIIGGGLAGLRSAIVSNDKGLNTVVLSLVPVKRSHSAAAQGGMQASLANGKKSEGDNEDVHFGDTVRGSDWGCDQRVARMFVQTAPKAIRELAGWGVPWSRVEKGDRRAIIDGKKVTITEDDSKHGLIHSRDFGGTKKWRTCYTADATGHTMLYGIANEALKRDISIIDRQEAISIIQKDGQCYGAIVRDLVTGEIYAYVAKATMIATGGYGRLYKNTTNAVICDGVGVALALETGVVGLGNMEAVQFHPTPLVPSGILLTEGCRGDGGVLRDKDGYRFMPDYEPEKKELASRDVVSRRMIEHIRSGKGVPSAYGDHLWLDISILGRKHIQENLRDVQDICKSFNAIDPADEGKKGWAPVLPMQHYSMGGVRTNEQGEVKNIKGLFCAGESACWDLHGFNRLGGNSVAESVVAGMIVGNYLADYANTCDIEISTSLIEKRLQEQQDYIKSLVEKDGSGNIFEIKEKMQTIMDTKVGIFRTGVHLKEAVKELEELYKQSLNVKIDSKKYTMNPVLEEAYRVPKMLKLALCVSQGALAREESRGAHSREDFPKRDDVKWLKRTIATWGKNDTKASLSYEELDIASMEIPPSYRGYGSKDNMTLSDDATNRQNQIDKIKKDNPKANRYEIQNLIMPYDLQDEYKIKNQRAKIGDI